MSTSYTIRWFVTVFVGLVFAACGAAKLFGDPVFAAWFRELGVPLHYMRALGLLEIAGALALSIPPLARHATVGLLGVALGAAAAQLLLAQPMDAVLPLLLATAAAIAVWGTPGHPASGPRPKVLVGAEAQPRRSPGSLPQRAWQA